jgi:hypothetical protein
MGFYRFLSAEFGTGGKSQLQRIRGESGLRWLPFIHLQFVRENVNGAGKRAGDGQPHSG